MVYFPLIVLPYDMHGQESLTERRRNVKVTNETIPAALAQLLIDVYDETGTLVDTKTINLNTAKELVEIADDAKYINCRLYCENDGTTIHDHLNWYIR
jgi:hypothetical protein